ncbi:hypothetical protein [Streptomyces sp. PR69]|uniref:hypothetical protein n=1 Tax=Streptomyces sp. PR69 TaxID=2984950 RepID=UPI00226402F4|nr:hypothetical protein [Streptomyces sp. PR69]
MNGTGWLAVGAAAWGASILAVLWMAWSAHRNNEPEHEEPAVEPEDFARGYMDTFDPMREAVASAHRETEPGGPSADLIDCWAIWPDAPSAADHDGTA